jgi:DsbC/DsbD-like thiol-disulfide interchange protein
VIAQGRHKGCSNEAKKVNMKTFVTLFCSFALACAVVCAQAPEHVVKAKVAMAPGAARPGSVMNATVVADVLPGYHINDHHPTLDYLIPTEVKLEPSKAVTRNDITYPKGEPKKFAFSDTPLSVYEGTVRVDVAFQLDPKVPPGDYEVKGKLAYQACNDHACLPPTSVPISFPLKVARGGASAKGSE